MSCSHTLPVKYGLGTQIKARSVMALLHSQDMGLLRPGLPGVSHLLTLQPGLGGHGFWYPMMSGFRGIDIFALAWTEFLLNGVFPRNQGLSSAHRFHIGIGT